MNGWYFIVIGLKLYVKFKRHLESSTILFMNKLYPPFLPPSSFYLSITPYSSFLPSFFSPSVLDWLRASYILKRYRTIELYCKPSFFFFLFWSRVSLSLSITCLNSIFSVVMQTWLCFLLVLASRVAGTWAGTTKNSFYSLIKEGILISLVVVCGCPHIDIIIFYNFYAYAFIFLNTNVNGIGFNFNVYFFIMGI